MMDELNGYRKGLSLEKTKVKPNLRDQTSVAKPRTSEFDLTQSILLESEVKVGESEAERKA